MLAVDGGLSTNTTNLSAHRDGEMQSQKVEMMVVGGSASGGFEEDGERKMMMESACHYIFKHLGFPLFTSQLFAGLILSPAVIGKTGSAKLITSAVVNGIGVFGAFGYSGFLFLTGVKMDPTMVIRVSKRAIYIGFLSIIPPAVFALTILQVFCDTEEEKYISMGIVVGYTASTFPVITCVLSELKIINSELGRIAQSSAVVSEILSIFLFVFCTLFKENFHETLMELTTVVIYTAFLFLVIRPAIKFFIRRLPEGKPVDDFFMGLLEFMFLISLLIAKWSPAFRFLGPHLLGLAIPDGPPVGSTLVEKLESMTNHIFLPMLFVTGGMRVEKLFFIPHNHLLVITAFTAAAAMMVKFGACLLPPLYNNMPLKDALTVSIIMCSKGAVELAEFIHLNDQKIIDAELYALLFDFILIMSIIVPMLVKTLYDPTRKYAGYHKRNIMALKPYSEVSIVTCIHVPDDVAAAINLLDVAMPSKDSPMVVNVLHLMKLRGQSTPIFISHDKKRIPDDSSYFENIIVSFNKFEGNNWGVLSFNAFTAVSSPSFMHEDICTLALDKTASLIILPFHRRWYIDGSVESDDKYIRTLNSRVLEMSPCSVGILIDRGKLNRPVDDDPLSEPEYKVAVIFIGGPDDREALTFAKRMVLNTRVTLTVIHLVAAENDEESNNWGKVLDTVILRDVKNNGYIHYKEEEVSDGPETATLLHSLVNEFNLMIVGRRVDLESPQTSGLTAWTEFPELGALGELLASKDYSSRCSVLIVQQQQTT
ncbi:cation/H(+) antiporter 4-like [Pistacia vera]|uniref:cation/H(+) antiporter 4-like n=1 Tax=Pistacia vera TaxID=55513 RepID=UPI001263BF93|nr:cation/H(+) antiporter 4-like [Pistacia vera]